MHEEVKVSDMSSEFLIMQAVLESFRPSQEVIKPIVKPSRRSQRTAAEVVELKRLAKAKRDRKAAKLKDKG